jgi:hypothetical protein
LQSEGYQRILQYVASRLQFEKMIDIQPEEIKLINLVRVILQGGWVIDTKVLQECLTVCGVDEH